MRHGPARRTATVLLVALLATAPVACASEEDTRPDTSSGGPDDAAGETRAGPPRLVAPEVVQRREREPTFTQGLEVLDDGTMVHSRGQYGQSGIDILDASGQVVRSRELPEEEFGEGVTVVPGSELGRGEPDTAYQLTWLSGTVRTWSVPDLQPGPSYRIDGEGWGLCYDATRQVLWQSDGSPRLRALGLPDLTPQGEVEVTEDGVGVEDLNELECVEGMVWANVWRSDDILLLDPQDGRVRQRVSLGEVVRAEGATGPEDVLNGIARADQGGLWVTGKNWGHLYRLEPGDDSG